jgi:hypothetical protein
MQSTSAAALWVCETKPIGGWKRSGTRGGGNGLDCVEAGLATAALGQCPQGQVVVFQSGKLGSARGEEMSAAITLIVLAAILWVGPRYEALDTIAGILILGYILMSCVLPAGMMVPDDDVRGGPRWLEEAKRAARAAAECPRPDPDLPFCEKLMDMISDHVMDDPEDIYGMVNYGNNKNAQISYTGTVFSAFFLELRSCV